MIIFLKNDLEITRSTQNKLTALLQEVFLSSTMNDFMGLTHLHWKETRATLQSLLSGADPCLKSDAGLMVSAFINQSEAKMLLPAKIGDYTDFYSSLDHATNVGIMFRLVIQAFPKMVLHIKQ